MREGAGVTIAKAATQPATRCESASECGVTRPVERPAQIVAEVMKSREES